MTEDDDSDIIAPFFYLFSMFGNKSLVSIDTGTLLIVISL